MFKLLRYFSIASAFILVAVTALFVIVYRHLAVQQVVAQGETANVSVAQIVSNTIWPDIAPHLPLASSQGGADEALNGQIDVAALRQTIVTHIRGLSILKVRIFDLEGLVLLSTDPDDETKGHGDSEAFYSARAGTVVSELVNRGTFRQFDRTKIIRAKDLWATIGKALMAVETRDVLDSYIPIRGESGQIEGVVEIYDDLSPIFYNIRQTQNVVMISIFLIFLSLYGILLLIARRAAHIIDDQNKEILSANRELESFAYVASHDLQEPLRMVASYCDLLKRRYGDKLDSEAGEFIDFAVDGAKRMQALIEDLLTYSRLGKKDKAFKPTDCQQALDLALANLRAAIAESGAIVTHDPMPTVKGDGDQMAQVFQNLISNAIKFRNHEVPRIHISAQKDGRNWVISVSDNGCGIESRYADRIFVIFQRLHNRREYPGTGIGLAICKKVIERHGGNIWMESEPGEGSTFHFTLPSMENRAT